MLSLALMRDPSALPHAYPFRFLAAGGEVEVRFLNSANAGCTRGGTLPQWVALEVLTQACGVLLGRPEAPGGFAVQVNRFKAPRPIDAAGALRLSASLIKRMGPVFQGRVVARNGKRIVAAGTFTIRENPQ